MQVHSVGDFQFENNRYTAEASSLGWPPGRVARELGIQHRSGVISRFTLARVQDELFEYKSVRGEDRVTIFND